MTKAGIHSLSQRDACSLIELIQESLACHDLDAFRGLMVKLKRVIVYDFTTCLVCKKGKDGQIQSLDVVNINYPSEWVELYVTRNYQQIDPVLKENFANFRLQYWADTYRKMPPPKEFLCLAEDFGLDRGYTHGVRSFTGEEGSLFSFSGRTVEHSERTATILDVFIPHLHQALCRVVKCESTRTAGSPLSLREKEVLQWMTQGKSSWDISRILHISERTVHFHGQNIKQKLNASSRSHAVAIAVEAGIIGLA
jgi:DNA-binding CsgD family transcriptional regulator